MSRKIGKQNEEAGSSSVEFALIAVLLLTVLFGVIDVGRALEAYHWVSNAARMATRYAMVRGTSCDPRLSGCEIGPPPGARESDVQNYVVTITQGVNPDNLTVTARCNPGSSGPQPLPCDPGQGVSVLIEYRFAFVSPFVPLSWTMSNRSQRPVSQ